MKTVAVEYFGGPDHGRIDHGMDPNTLGRLPQFGSAYTYRRILAHEEQPGAPKAVDPILLFHVSITDEKALETLRERGQA